MLEYSTSALNVLHRFHRAKAMVYVEGQDDVLFWNYIAKKAGVIEDVRIEEVGGDPEIVKKIDAIVNDGANIIVAKDCDHSNYLAAPLYHDKIVLTYGYSIENFLYCSNTLSDFISKLSRFEDDYSDQIEDWYGEFTKKSKVLLTYDIANHRFSRGVKVLGDSCSRFLKNSQSPEISESKVESFIDEIKERFSEGEIEEVEQLLDTETKEYRWLIKGHFLTSGVINLVKKIVKAKRGSNTTISVEHLFTSTVEGCANCVPATCESLKKMTEDLQKAVASC